MTGTGNTIQCQAWRQRIYSRHRSLAHFLEKEHLRRARKDGFVKANRWLGDFEASLKIGNSGMFCDASDRELLDYCEAKSKKTYARMLEAANTIGTATEENQKRVVEFVRDEVGKAGINFPLPVVDYTKKEAIPALGRACDAAWWLKQMRKTAARQYERTVRALGMVSVSRQIYCSDFTLQRRTNQRRRNRKLLEALEAVNSEGHAINLAEIADKSISNPILRRNELMTRISGFEDYAKARRFDDSGTPIEYRGIFLTLTAPSKYHAVVTRKTEAGRRFTLQNRKFNGADPRQAHSYLCKVWASIRAEWGRRGIHPFGFRMVEPHHDGTPHWHMILFIPENRMIETSYVFWKYAMREDADEAGAREARAELVYIDPTKGSAAGYCAKYVAKNIDGFAVGNDLYGRDALMSAARIEAWASTWGIRQFQQIGGPSVTVYREARRIKNREVEVELSPEAEKIVDAADAGDWENYTELMGGAVCPLKERPVRPYMIQRTTENKYAEFTKVLKGLLEAGKARITKREIWIIRPASRSESGNEAWSSSLNGFTSPEAA